MRLPRNGRTGGGFKGKLADTWVLPTYGKLTARYVVLVGLGKPGDCDGAAIRRASAAAIRACQPLKVRHVASALQGFDAASSQSNTPVSDTPVSNTFMRQAARWVAEGVMLGNYRFTYRKTKDTPPGITQWTLLAPDTTSVDAVQAGVDEAQVIAYGTLGARDLVFDSANHVTPTTFRQKAEALQGVPGFSVTVLDRNAMADHGMGAFLSVAQGSDEPPYLIHIAYTPPKSVTAGKSPKKLALVGKGVTFDSGGLSLKPSKSQELMKLDMAGAATVYGVMSALAALVEAHPSMAPGIRVDGFIATCENMPSAHATRPGDIVTSMNGQTIEINNTDAEGRMILIDTLTYAQQVLDPDEIVDLATLTGACVVALGETAAAILGTDDSLIDRIRQSGMHAGEKFWPLPLYKEYAESLKSDVADLINAGSKGKAGTSSAAMFLKAFVDDGRKWVHLDIAGPAYTSGDCPEVPKGATGFGVRTLLYDILQLT